MVYLFQNCHHNFQGNLQIYFEEKWRLYLNWCFKCIRYPATSSSSHGPLTRYAKFAGCACARNAGNIYIYIYIPHHRFQSKPLASDPDMHHGTCVTHVPWCMSGELTRGDGEKVPSIPGTCASVNFAYLARGPWLWVLLPRASWPQNVQNLSQSFNHLPGCTGSKMFCLRCFYRPLWCTFLCYGYRKYLNGTMIQVTYAMCHPWFADTDTILVIILNTQ